MKATAPIKYGNANNTYVVSVIQGPDDNNWAIAVTLNGERLSTTTGPADRVLQTWNEFNKLSKLTIASESRNACFKKMLDDLKRGKLIYG